MTKKQFFNLPLINAHTHAAMVAFRGLVEDMPLKKWLEEYIWPFEREKVNSDFVYKQTKAAIKEMRQNGIRAFCDMYFFEDAAAKAAEEMKMPALVGEVILDFKTPSAKNPKEALEIAERLLKKYKNSRYVKVAVAPHSIYAVSEEILLEAKKLADKYEAVYHIHLSETKREFEECLKKRKTTPVGYLDKLGILNSRTLLAHCVWVTDKDIGILAKRKAKVAHCPLSNLKLGSGIAPIAKMLKKGVVVALGTDGAASSNRLDIWEAGKIAALLQKGITNDSTAIPAAKAVEMMTINGMLALGMKKIDGKSLSVFEKQMSRGKYDFLYEANVENLKFM